MTETVIEGGLHSLKKARVVVGLDPSLTAFGITALDVNTCDYCTWVYESKHRGVERLLDLKAFLEATMLGLLVVYGAEHVCIENYSFGSKGNLVQAGEVGGLTRLVVAEVFGITEVAGHPTPVAPVQLKKYACGPSEARKELVLLHVYKKWGVEFADNNAADSYVLARIAGSLITGKTDHKYEQEVIDKVRPNVWTLENSKAPPKK